MKRLALHRRMPSMMLAWFQRVGDDSVLGAEQAFKKAAVGVIAGRVEDGILGVVEFRDLFLQSLVQVLRAADEAHRGQAETVLIQGLVGGLDQIGMVGQAKVIVGAEIQDFAWLGSGRERDVNSRFLAGEDQPLLFQEPRILDLDQFLVKIVFYALVHGFSLAFYFTPKRCINKDGLGLKKAFWRRWYGELLLFFFFLRYSRHS